MTATLAEPALEIRSGYAVAEVNYPKRIVTCIAMPYEDPAEVWHEGQWVTEVVSRGAFNGIEKRSSRIRANRDHSWDKLCGKIVGLHPSRAEGLVAEVKMFGTTIGEDTLIECDGGGLDASAGFRLLLRDDGRVWDDAETWEGNRTVRRLNRLHLDHLAFVPNPAYEGATVLNVRDNEPRPTGSVTPNRDRLEIDALKARKDELDRRWLYSR